MHEHLRNVRLSWVAFGWFIAVALCALGLMALTSLDLLRPGASEEGMWVAVTLAVGFLVSGYFIGTRIAAAPLLNGLAMGLFSVIAWAALNVFLGEPTGSAAWGVLGPAASASLLVLQTAAAVLGVRAGVRWARRND